MRDEQGRTVLMFPARWGHLECVKILAPLEKGMKCTSRQYINGAYYEDVTALAFTLGGGDSYKQYAQYLYQFPEERDTDALDALKSKYGLE